MSHLFWVLFIFFCLHNAEEYLAMERFGAGPFQRLSKDRFLAALVVVTFLALFCVLLGVSEGSGPGARFAALLFPASMALNGLIHLAASILYRRYTPGVVSGLLAVAPLSIWLLVFAVGSGYAPRASVWWSLAAALVLQYPVIKLALFLGGLVTRPNR